uniref:Uncharacterized protein n=1 Tax=Pseudo-nitzschia australis TaxID=44445 RepID=A0A7S4EQ34_9STRA|mmetsp:Transcript_15102/g.32398  ORF Transcript_15102/g.32398 Transcript_15102/m.32398 type:complete len:146 (+) Transcript_15102:394-831(+)
MLRSIRSSAAPLRRMCGGGVDGRRAPRQRMEFHSRIQRPLGPSTRKGTKTTIQRRTFFSDRNNSSPELDGYTRFTPLEDFVLDVSAWMVAVTLWYAPRMEIDDDLFGENQDSNLEYREDYGPCSSSSKTGRQNPKKQKEKENEED